MADKYEINLKIKADVAEIKNATLKIKELQEQFRSTIGQLKQGFEFNIGAGIGNQIKSILSSAIPAYGKQEEAERGLANAMEATGVSVQKNIEYFKELAGKIQDATKIGDETVLGMQSLALNMGVNAEQMQECIQGAIGLQRAYGIGLNEAIRASASVVQGKTEKLNELIPALSKCKPNEEKLAMANRAMNNGYKQAKGDIDTLNGTLTQLYNAWGDVAEILGEAVAPAVKALAELLKGLADIIRNCSTAVVWLTRGIVAFVALLAVNKIGNYMKALKGMINSFKDGAVAVASETKALNENTAAKLRNATASKALNASNSGKSKHHLEGGFKAFMRQTSKPKAPKTLYSLIVDARKTVEAKKLAQATQSLAQATANVGVMSRISATGLKVFASAFNPVTIAISAATAAISYLYSKFAECREAQGELQDMFDSTASGATSRSNALMEKMKSEGAELEEVFKNRKTIETELRGLLNAKRIAEENNDSWNPFVKDVDVKALDNAIASNRKMITEINAEAEAYDRMVRARNEAYEEKASENMRQSKNKYSDTKLTDQEKLSRLTDQLAIKKQTISDIENNIKNAQGEQKLKLSEIYKIETDKLIALEKEQSVLQKSVDAEKKAAQDKVDAKAKEISDSEKRLLQMQRELSFESELNLAKIQGNTKEVERLETKKRVADLAKQIVEAGKTQYTTAEELKKLERDAMETAKRKVDLENQALRAEQEKAQLKEREKSVEDYVYRIKVAQAKLRGDNKEVKRLEEEKATKQEVDALVGQGIERGQAENMVRKTRDAENLAQEKDNARASSLGTTGGKSKERKRPSTISDKYADKYAEFQEAKKNGTLGKDKFGKTMGWNDFRDGKGVGGTLQNGFSKKNALSNIQPPSPPTNGKQTENPANEAGGKAENKKEDEIIRILKENQETLKKYDETIKNIEQNTATLAISKNSKD